MMRRYLGFVAFVASLMLPATAAAQNILDGMLGAACESDADCTAGLTCIPASSKALAGRGPAGGLCTATCTTDADCAAWGNPAYPAQPACESIAGKLLCLDGCNFGLVDQPFDQRCHERSDFGCQASGRPPPPFVPYTLGECVPLCSSDAQCAGRHCSAALGLCQDEVVTGDPVGTSCDPDASEPTCAGFCDGGAAGGEGAGGGGQGSPGACSQRCVVNGPVGCGWSGEGTPMASCHRVLEGAGPGDVSQCAQLCNCDTDCLASGYVCEPGTGRGAFGAAGTCTPAATTQHHIPECQVQTDFGACIYGAVRACKGPGDCFGSASCLDDKSGYGKCECVDAALGGGGQANGGAGAGGESLGGAESLGGIAASAGGVAAGDSTGPSPSGKTPEPGCSCSVPPVTSRFGWLTLLLASGLFVHLRLRRGRRMARTIFKLGAEP